MWPAHHHFIEVGDKMVKESKQKKVESEKRKQWKKDENVLQKRDIQERPKEEISYGEVRKSKEICWEESERNQSECNNLLFIITTIMV